MHMKKNQRLPHKIWILDQFIQSAKYCFKYIFSNSFLYLSNFWNDSHISNFVQRFTFIFGLINFYFDKIQTEFRFYRNTERMQMAKNRTWKIIISPAVRQKRNCAFPLQIDQMTTTVCCGIGKKRTEKERGRERERDGASKKAQNSQKVSSSLAFAQHYNTVFVSLWPDVRLDKVVILTVTMSFYCFIPIFFRLYLHFHIQICAQSKCKLMAFESLSKLISLVSPAHTMLLVVVLFLLLFLFLSLSHSLCSVSDPIWLRNAQSICCERLKSIQVTRYQRSFSDNLTDAFTSVFLTANKKKIWTKKKRTAHHICVSHTLAHIHSVYYTHEISFRFTRIFLFMHHRQSKWEVF